MVRDWTLPLKPGSKARNVLAHDSCSTVLQSLASGVQGKNIYKVYCSGSFTSSRMQNYKVSRRKIYVTLALVISF